MGSNPNANIGFFSRSQAPFKDYKSVPILGTSHFNFLNYLCNTSNIRSSYIICNVPVSYQWSKKFFSCLLSLKIWAKKLGFIFGSATPRIDRDASNIQILVKLVQRGRKKRKKPMKINSTLPQPNVPASLWIMNAQKKNIFLPKSFFYQRREKGKVRELVSEKELNNVARVCTF